MKKGILKPVIVALILIVIVIVVGGILTAKSMEQAAKEPLQNIAINQVASNTTTTSNEENKVEENVVENVTNEVSNTTEGNVTDGNTVTTPAPTNVYEEYAQKQFKMPEMGDEIAVITVKKYGQIVVKFFPESAPKAVENFVTHAKNGYYNGVTFHRVINEFMIQGGDPKGDGTGGETIWGEGIAEEIDKKLVPYRGALMMASRGTGTKSIGSQFFIVQANYNPTMRKILNQSGYTKDLLDCYRNYGGYMSLYGEYTLFGQVISGMDVVDAIASVKEVNQHSKPAEDIIIESIQVTTYQGS